MFSPSSPLCGPTAPTTSPKRPHDDTGAPVAAIVNESDAAEESDAESNPPAKKQQVFSFGFESIPEDSDESSAPGGGVEEYKDAAAY